MRGRVKVAFALACVLIAVEAPVRAAPGDVELNADAGAKAIAPTNRRLIGVGWDRAPFAPRVMSPLRPHLVRMDASLEHLYAKGRTPDREALSALLTEAREVLSIGSTPVVILSYTPEWLADERPSSDRTKVPPSDADAWRSLVTDVVERLSAIGVRWFEAWNEPDLPIFFQGVLDEFLDDVYRPSAQAILAVEKRTGRDLHFGGCACFFADPAWIVPMMEYARRNALPLDFISWHHYGNTPFLGPDGAEPLGPPEFRPALVPLRQRNPSTSPVAYADQVQEVRAWRDVVYAGGGRKPELWIDEWNLSAGGFDRRHDLVEGAAFQVAVLIELQRAGLDRASVFRSIDPAYGAEVVPRKPELYGGWGLVGRAGTIKPAWRGHRFWRELGRDVLALSGSTDARLGVSAVLTRGAPGRFVALAANFRATHGSARRLVISVGRAPPGPWSVRISALDGTQRRRVLVVRGQLVVPVDLEPQSAMLVEMRAA